jgi:hypothetical protein
VGDALEGGHDGGGIVAAQPEGLLGEALGGGAREIASEESGGAAFGAAGEIALHVGDEVALEVLLVGLFGRGELLR